MWDVSFWGCFSVLVLGPCLATTARNAARFCFLFFGVVLFLVWLFFCKVLLGLGCCSNDFGLTNCLSPKGFVFGLAMC